MNKPLLFVKKNHIGWVHVWISKDDFDNGIASSVFLDSRVDPYWVQLKRMLSPAQQRALNEGKGIEIQDPGFLLDIE